MIPEEFAVYLAVRSVEQLPTSASSGVLVKATQRPLHEMNWSGSDLSLFFVMSEGYAPQPGDILQVTIKRRYDTDEQTGSAGVDGVGPPVAHTLEV